MPSSDEIAVVWFRRDLRLDDNPAWAAATSACKAVVPLYVFDPRLVERAGPYRRRQLIATIQALDYDLFERVGGRLLVRIGDPVKLVPRTVAYYGAGALYLNADVTPFATRRDELVAKELEVPIETHWGSLVHPPGSVLTKKGSLSRVFTAFHKAWSAKEMVPWPTPGEAAVSDHPGKALPALDGPAPVPEGEDEARRRLEAFVERIERYDDRDRVDLDITSHLSTDLKFGMLSPRTVLDAVGEGTPARDAFRRQLAWRDWFAHLLLDIPSLPHKAMKAKFDGITWRNDPGEIAAWKGGFTGYPFVDAGMRQLRETGWIHNRVRMVCGSFLVKNLLVDWRIGEQHFRHLLVDGDTAQNVGNWQWVAGTGPDAAPYHRVMNPVSQSRAHDPAGSFIRRWVPELADVDDEHVHAPWDADLELDYPAPIVDLAESRARALEAYKSV